MVPLLLLMSKKVRFICVDWSGVTIQPFQTPPMARPRFHSCHTEPASVPASSSSTLGFQNFNLLPVKDTNGKKMSTAASNDNNNKTVTAALEETDVIPVKESPSPSTAKENNPAAEKDLNILDKDLEEKFKSKFILVTFQSMFIFKMFVFNQGRHFLYKYKTRSRLTTDRRVY